MSRGLGKHQRFILATLERNADRHGNEKWWPGGVFDQRDESEIREAGGRQSRSELESTRRALRSLENLGLVDVQRKPKAVPGLPGVRPEDGERSRLYARLSVGRQQEKSNTYPHDEGTAVPAALAVGPRS
jgi:hypothetical protein